MPVINIPEKTLSEVQNGNKTTTFYNIPRSTLKHYILGTRGKGNTYMDGKRGGGVSSYLSKNEEIANCLKVMEKNGFGLSRRSYRYG